RGPGARSGVPAAGRAYHPRGGVHGAVRRGAGGGAGKGADMGSCWPDLASLELFLLVVEEGSIGKAAARTGLTQASASRRLDTLERDLGVPLLVRGAGGSRPTAQRRPAPPGTSRCWPPPATSPGAWRRCA